MNNIYLIAPLVSLLIFGGVYSRYARAYAARAAETQRLEASARAAKKTADDAAKANALETARVAQIRRSDERAELTRKEEIQRQARRTLEEQRASAATEIGRLRPQLGALRRELEAMEATVDRDEARARQLRQKEITIHEHAKQTAARQADIGQLLERLQTFEPRHPAFSGTKTAQRPRG